jgi:3-hydroxyisobutyrate dehydrogenase-like beta-hydroxyacid dehydrogenase
MSKISVLGLGAMGSRMAAHLIKAGHDVTVWNRTADATKPLVVNRQTIIPTAFRWQMVVPTVLNS